MTIATLFALYGDDFRLAVLPKSLDDMIYILIFICLLLFTWEFITYCICKKICMVFFFWLDLIAMLSLLLDIPWIIDIDNDNNSENDLSVARASKASRAGGRAGRVVRIIRIVRLFRVVKFYKYFGNNSKDNPDDHLNTSQQQQQQIVNKDDEGKFSNELSGSKIGEKLSDNTTKGVIIGVLLMLFMLPYLEVTEINVAISYNISQLYEYIFSTNANTLFSSNFITNAINSFQIQWSDRILKLNINNTEYINPLVSYNHLRSNEIGIYTAGDNDIICWMNNSSLTSIEALYGIALTTAVMIVLGVGAYLFTNDAEIAVVRPIESMVQFVKMIAQNPLAKISPEQMYSSNNSKNETALLQSTLMKLAGLLQIAFGDAGSEIISKNLIDDTINPMLKGQKIYAIFGFCDIRHFDDVNQALEEQIMGFVNTIAETVHEVCHTYQGHANKNTGAAFLLVWKFPKEEIDDNYDDTIIDINVLKSLLRTKATKTSSFISMPKNVDIEKNAHIDQKVHELVSADLNQKEEDDKEEQEEEQEKEEQGGGEQEKEEEGEGEGEQQKQQQQTTTTITSS